jgi:diguanylate cyclase (GGDEF)-like protein
MLTRLSNAISGWFRPPIFPGDEEKTYRASLLNAITLSIFTAVLIIYPIVICHPGYPLAIKIADGLILMVNILLRTLLYQGRVSSASYLGTVAGLVLITVAVISLGTVNTPTTATFLFIIIMAGILFGTPGVLATATYVSLTVGTIIYAETHGILPGASYRPDYSYFVIYSLIFFLTATLTNYSLRATRCALERARAEIGERTRIETELRESQDRYREVNEQLARRISEVEQLHIELREQAIRDPLTGLYNRRYLKDALDRELSRVQRDGSGLSVLVADLDHFKLINDTYGHQMGDHFLVETAALIVNAVRASDIVCRYGGEEFIIILPGVSVESARARAENIRDLVEHQVHATTGVSMGVTISFGLASFPTHTLSAEQLILRADRALYHSKETGRNRITVWQPGI